ncbi:unnamed protein product [Orchesella dallaii]|uniref:Sorting nexin-13 n=1 Tax=Orchesella dallaii TaxID=48710 RepID=A0ABP1QTJ3_9HEXA
MDRVILMKSRWLYVGGLCIGVYAVFGFQIVVGLVTAALAVIAGICFKVYLYSANNSDDKTRVKLTVSSRSYTVSSPTRYSRQKLDMRLSGSAIIDETLHEMIDFVLRDYIHSWYDYVSEDDEFIHELRKALQEILVNLSSRVKEIDWIPFLTTSLVDDAASHLRLYRTALNKVKENSNRDLLSEFFDLEANMEKNLCRDMVCIDDSHLQDYLNGIMESIMYLLLSPDIYGCSPIGVLAQDLVVQYVLMPVLNMISDPDFVNQYVVWLCQGFPISGEAFLTVIRTSDSQEEMTAVDTFFQDQHQELKRLQAELGEDSAMKQQAKYLALIRKAVEQRISSLKDGDKDDWNEEWQNYLMSPGVKLHNLSLNEILKDSVAMSYFLDYMNSVGGTNHLLLLLNTHAWRNSANNQLLAIESSNKNSQVGRDESENNQAMLECLRDSASNVYDEFLAETAVHKVKLPENVIKRFHIQLRTESIRLSLFEDIQETLVDIMQNTEKFYPSFIRNKLYVKCLMELDLLKGDSMSANSGSDEEDEDLCSLEEDIMDQQDRDIDEYQTCRDCLKIRMQSLGLRSDELLSWEKSYLDKKYRLYAEIIEAGLTSEKGKQFGVYAVAVTRKGIVDGIEKKWHIYRRYSDFYDFHQWIKSKWMRMNRIEFPGKQAFGTTDRAFLERRMAALNKYLSIIFSFTSEQCFGESLQDALLHFFEPGNYQVKKKQLSEKLDNFVNPLKQSVKTVTHAVKSAPDSFINTFDGFTKIFSSKSPESDQFSTLKVGSSIDTEVDDNIPLRIILLMMDEVFDLKSRNQWLRRRIVAFIREILKAMLGDTINRRIVDYVAYLTSPDRVSGYLRNLQRTLWPNGQRMGQSSSRDNPTKMRTRVAAKAALLSCISDELKRLLGSDTTRRGVLCVFDLLQNRVLNRRLTLVLFEGILKNLFPDKPLVSIIQRLHYRSNRVGKNRPFIVPNSKLNPGTSVTMAHLSPRGSRKKKSA